MKLLRGFTRKSLLLAITSCVCLFATTASAEYIQFTFTGEVTVIGGTPWDVWQDTQLGNPVTLQFIVDSNAEDQLSTGDAGEYYTVEMILTMGVVSQVAVTGSIIIYYDYLSGVPDAYLPSYHFADGSLGNAYVLGIDIFSSDALPTGVDWTQYAYAAGGSLYSELSSEHYISYELNNFETVVVPTTPTLVVLLLGISRRHRRV